MMHACIVMKKSEHACKAQLKERGVIQNNKYTKLQIKFSRNTSRGKVVGEMVGRLNNNISW